LRASPAIKADIKTICQSMRLATDDQALFALEIRFWDALLLGADNLAYRLAFNGMMQSLQLMPEAVQAWGLNEVRKSDCHQALCEAIARGDAEAAELDVKTLMRDGLAAFSKFSERVAETGSTANRA
jgi:DNA-binding FadR family transcriptional regulator